MFTEEYPVALLEDFYQDLHGPYFDSKGTVFDFCVMAEVPDKYFLMWLKMMYTEGFRVKEIIKSYYPDCPDITALIT